MKTVCYETADGTDLYRCDEYHTDKEGMLTAIQESEDAGVVSTRTFPMERVIYIQD